MIFKFLKNSTDNFFQNILGLEVKECKTTRMKNFYYSQISIYQNDIEYNILFLFKKETINLVAKHLMFEENLNEESMIDLLKEMANLIGGTAKTMLEEFDQNATYKLSTPEYLGMINDAKKLNLSYIITGKLNNRCFLIGAKEI